MIDVIKEFDLAIHLTITMKTILDEMERTAQNKKNSKVIITYPIEHELANFEPILHQLKILVRILDSELFLKEYKINKTQDSSLLLPNQMPIPLNQNSENVV